ncbi:glycine cleavage system H protein [Trichodelitschia bisporula]|uniref:Glycine cleavage system H protein n=1 Tax=Trichodelitschia bisporula TaxID=703511 RepID=A0A6G1HRW9_9PEZI|nr:glycine cleavage system H protein [Trichodelitschia bisporula]
MGAFRAAGMQRRGFAVAAMLRVKKYTEDHEWVELGEDGVCNLGISKYAANALGDVIYVELPELDMEVGFGDTVGAVESVKSASDIMAPVSGKVVATNEALEEKPGLLNQDPEGEGWIAKIKVEHEEELDGLMDEEAYIKFTEESS